MRISNLLPGRAASKIATNTSFSAGRESDIEDVDAPAGDIKGERHSTTSAELKEPEESISSETPAGIQKMQATTSVWSKSNLIAAYAM